MSKLQVMIRYKQIRAMSRKCYLLLSIILLGLTVAACNSTDIANVNFDDATFKQTLNTMGITGDPTTGRNLPSINDPKAQLGKLLFFTKGLGGDSDSACVTCHHPMLGGGDNLSLSIGVGAETPDLLGPGRAHSANASGGEFDGGPTVPRNAPSTFNLAMWDQALFHDGRVESLGKTPGKNGNDQLGIRTPDSEFGIADPNAGSTLAAAQSRFPVTSPEEMRGFSFEAGNDNTAVRTALENKLAANWDTEFSNVFGDMSVTFPRIAEAIGEYERSQVFVDNPWKSYVQGDNNAITDSAKRGAWLFFNTVENGGANCATCHSGDFFTDEQYHVLATPQIGRGKGNDNGIFANDDFGRFRETKNLSDKYKFRTPSLLNVEVTGPWGHAGAYTTLEGIVRHMLNPEIAISEYDTAQLDPSILTTGMLTNTQFSLEQLKNNRANGVANAHQNVLFNDNDVTDLVEFLKTLTDPCVKSRTCLAPWIPKENDPDPDGLRVRAIDNYGNLL